MNKTNLSIKGHKLLRLPENKYKVLESKHPTRIANENRYFECKNCGFIFYEDKRYGLRLSIVCDRFKTKIENVVSCEEKLMKEALE